LDCKKNNIEYQVIHNASVLTAVAGILGLQHYNFGPVATLVLPEGNYRPLSPIDKIKANMKNGNHTLVLLDIKADQPDKEPIYMRASEAAEQIIEAGLSGEIKVAAAARVGRESQKLWYGKLKELKELDLGKEPHSLVVPSRLHFTEKEFLENL
jgi:diphthine synthase